MNWFIIVPDVLIGSCVLIVWGYMLTIGRWKHKRTVQRAEDFIAYLDNCLLVLKSDEDEETINAMLLYLHKQWVAAHPEATREVQRHPDNR